MAKARRGNGAFRELWLRALRSALGGVPLPADTVGLADHPQVIVRLYVAGIRWAEDGDVPAARGAAAEAIRSGEAHAASMGCHLLMQLGPAAGDVVPLVWGQLRNADAMVKGNAGFVLLNCCPDRRTLAEAAAVLESDDGGHYLVRFAAQKLRRAAEAGPAFVPDPRWWTDDTVALARGIASDRAWHRLPLLADALQDAGCEHPLVLDHCRRPEAGAEFSWVVRLLLGPPPVSPDAQAATW